MWRWESTWRTLVASLMMDAYDLLLLYLPYCVLKKVITCLDEVLIKHPEFLSQFKSHQSGKVILQFTIILSLCWTRFKIMSIPCQNNWLIYIYISVFMVHFSTSSKMLTIHIKFLILRLSVVLNNPVICRLVITWGQFIWQLGREEMDLSSTQSRVWFTWWP